MRIKHHEQQTTAKKNKSRNRPATMAEASSKRRHYVYLMCSTADLMKSLILNAASLPI